MMKRGHDQSCDLRACGNFLCEFSLGFVVTFWTCAGLQTEIGEGAENFGEEFFLFRHGQTLYSKYFTYEENCEFSREILSTKHAP
jgi:hypothetical protein